MERLSKIDALQRLKKALDAIPELKQGHSLSPDFKKWYRNTEVAIENTFGTKSRHIKDFKGVRFSLAFATIGTPGFKHEQAYARGLNAASSVLQSMIEEVEEYWKDDASAEPDAAKARREVDSSNRNVFLIHGHDDGTKETVARFISKLGLTPIILHEQPNEGRTIIEKFETHAGVAYAVALLTPDDVGGAATQDAAMKPRARQNVLFEFGYFIGRLGRKRVCGLVVGNVEIPSDYSGVLYVPFDEHGAWRMSLVRELKTIGIDVDANLAL